jgi:hypothetical protein
MHKEYIKAKIYNCRVKFWGLEEYNVNKNPRPSIQFFPFFRFSAYFLYLLQPRLSSSPTHLYSRCVFWWLDVMNSESSCFITWYEYNHKIGTLITLWFVAWSFLSQLQLGRISRWIDGVCFSSFLSWKVIHGSTSSLQEDPVHSNMLHSVLVHSNGASRWWTRVWNMWEGSPLCKSLFLYPHCRRV